MRSSKIRPKSKRPFSRDENRCCDDTFSEETEETEESPFNNNNTMKKMFMVSFFQQKFLLALLIVAASAAGQQQGIIVSAFVHPQTTTITINTAFLPRTNTRRNTRLYDTEKPDSRLAAAAAAAPSPKAKQAALEIKQPPLVQHDDSGDTVIAEEAEAASHDDDEHSQVSKVPFKIRLGGNKELWFAKETGKFHENSVNENAFPLATIFERTVDTVEDAILHARRAPYEKGWIEYPKHDMTKSILSTIVVLGSGWASHALMKVADTYKMRLIIISPVNHFVFTPMLASSAVGTVEYRSMTEATRAANPMIEQYIEGKAINLDVEKQILYCKVQELLTDTRGTIGSGDHGQEDDTPIVEIKYDKLIVAVGCKVLDTIVPGADKYTYKLKTCDDARLLRTAVGECLEYACRPHVAPISNLTAEEAQYRQELRRKRLTWIIVGGGPTGVELAGELSDFVKDITKSRVGSYHKLRGEVRIVLVQGAPFLVPQFDEPLRKHALETLTRQNVDVKLDTIVKEVGDGWIKLQKKGETSEVETLDFGLCVWAAGIAPVPFVDTLLSKLPEQAKGPNGRIKVDKWLRCPTKTPETFGSILVMGDAAAFESSSSSQENGGSITVLPQTAQVAAQQGAFVARMLDRGYNLSQTPPILPLDSDDKDDDDFAIAWLKVRGLQKAPGFKFLNLGMLAYLGEGKALSQITLGDVPIFSYAGSVAFMLWRSVYLVKQVATRNRILVLFDWAKCKIFGRDITRL